MNLRTRQIVIALWTLLSVAAAALPASAQEKPFLGVTRHRIEPPPGGSGSFASSVAVAGDTVFIATPRAPRAGGGDGRVFRYGKDASGSWVLQGELLPAATAVWFGHTVVASADLPVIEDYAVVAATAEVVDATTSPPTTGAVYLFERNAGGAGSWGQSARIPNPERPGNGVFGFAVATDGQWLAVSVTSREVGGSPANLVRLYERSSGTWILRSTVDAGTVPNSSSFGGGVSISDGTLLVGDSFGGADRQGRVHVFRRNRTTGAWERLQVLEPTASCRASSLCRLSPNARVHKGTMFYSAAAPGEINWMGSTSTTWRFIRNVAPTPAVRGTASWMELAPGLLVTSGPGGNTDVGEAYIHYQHYPTRGTGWGRVATLTPEHTRTATGFGLTADISQLAAVVSASRDSGTGAAYIFDLNFGAPGAPMPAPSSSAPAPPPSESPPPAASASPAEPAAPPATPPRRNCGCRAVGAAPGAGAHWLLLALVLLRRRRSRLCNAKVSRRH